MDRHKDTARVQRLEVIELGRRRRWPAETKLQIAEARRHGISSSLLFAWRQADRAGTLVGSVPAGFVPAVVVEEPAPSTASAPSRIEIVTPNGHHLFVDGGVDEAVLARVLAVLARA
jgi:transposase